MKYTAGAMPNASAAAAKKDTVQREQRSKYARRNRESDVAQVCERLVPGMRTHSVFYISHRIWRSKGARSI